MAISINSPKPTCCANCTYWQESQHGLGRCIVLVGATVAWGGKGCMWYRETKEELTGEDWRQAKAQAEEEKRKQELTLDDIKAGATTAAICQWSRERKQLLGNGCPNCGTTLVWDDYGRVWCPVCGFKKED